MNVGVAKHLSQIILDNHDITLLFGEHNLIIPCSLFLVQLVPHFFLIALDDDQIGYQVTYNLRHASGFAFLVKYSQICFSQNFTYSRCQLYVASFRFFQLHAQLLTLYVSQIIPLSCFRVYGLSLHHCICPKCLVNLVYQFPCPPVYDLGSRVFSCRHANLSEALSVRRSIHQSIHLSVCWSICNDPVEKWKNEHF